jgi:hypothetical protein
MALDSGIAGEAGRCCPTDYRIDPAELDRAPNIIADTIYVVGGLYGNAFALNAVEELVAREMGTVALVFNGDAHWFDAECEAFSILDSRLAAYPAIRGNVETEIARQGDIGAGCGCAYPPTVDQRVVERSNAILARLKMVASGFDTTRERLAGLPTSLVATVGDVRIGIVHGDATSIAGWDFARERLDDPAMQPWLASVATAARIDVFASTHTCGAVMRRIGTAQRPVIVANNGAAGMGNFRGDPHGVVTRLSTTPIEGALYGTVIRSVHVDAISVPYDVTAFLAEFDRIWPAGSPAEVSYRQRILAGANDEIGAAAPR